jgi:predicted transcriptional regulator
MKFRKLYWVTEQLDENNGSQVAGVFTSIQDLVEKGLLFIDDIDKRHGFRLTLVKLDSRKKPLGSWVSPDYPGIEDDLAEYVKTQEFGVNEIEELVEALKAFQVPV